jgi:uncharacterized protein (TIGR00661 family)
MKILYAIQGTGNGHLARATELVPMLKKMAETDVLVSGIQGDLKLPFQVDYQLFGLSFIFGKKGGVSLAGTLKSARPFRLLKDIYRLPVQQYDLVLSDFEPVTAWACRLRKKACIGISHQNAVLHPDAPLPSKSNALGKFVLKHYAPATKKYGFHFRALDEFNFTPVIRADIRHAKVTTREHFTVYLPAYSDQEIIDALGSFPGTKWEVFSKHCKQAYEPDNISIRPVSLVNFTKSFTSCKGILCTAGFETPAEALFMGKKLCVIPMKNQFEQACNAAFLESMGILALPELRNQHARIKAWLRDNHVRQIHYPDQTKEILETILFLHD